MAQCAYLGCFDEARAWRGRGPRPKYCKQHRPGSPQGMRSFSSSADSPPRPPDDIRLALRRQLVDIFMKWDRQLEEWRRGA